MIKSNFYVTILSPAQTTAERALSSLNDSGSQMTRHGNTWFRFGKHWVKG